MSKSCCSHSGPATPVVDPGYRRVLWIALWVNAGMFAVEIASSLASGSASLLADAVDFAGDASNYALSLAALATGALAWRLRAAQVKGWAMTAYGLAVLLHAAWSAWSGIVPGATTMGLLGSGSGWPAHAVAVFMGLLALSAGASTLRQAGAELRELRAHAA